MGSKWEREEDLAKTQYNTPLLTPLLGFHRGKLPVGRNGGKGCREVRGSEAREGVGKGW